MEANNWRSSTFESIMASILTGESAGEGGSLRRLNSANIQRTVDRISTVLSDISSSGLGMEAQAMVRKIARLTSELALQFGVQPSHLSLSLPARKQLVEIGKEFHDCIDGDINRGDRVLVDLVVSPGLNRVGDGKGSTERRALMPCEVFPLP